MFRLHEQFIFGRTNAVQLCCPIECTGNTALTEGWIIKNTTTLNASNWREVISTFVQSVRRVAIHFIKYQNHSENKFPSDFC